MQKIKPSVITIIGDNEILPCAQEKMEEMKMSLAKRAFVLDKLSSRQYQQFVMDYLSYATGRYGLKNLKFFYDSEKPKFNAETYQGDNLIAYDKHVFFKPASFKSLASVIDTFEHEIAHNIQFVKRPYDYKKFVNESGEKIIIPQYSELLWLAKICNRKSAFNIKKIANAIYYDNYEEKFARRQAIFGTMEFFYVMKKFAKDNNLLNKRGIKEKLNAYKNEIDACVKDEKYYENYSKTYLDEKSNALKETRRIIECILKDSIDGKIYLDEDLKDFCYLFAEPKITTQSQRDRFHKYLLSYALKTCNEDQVDICLCTDAILTTFPENKYTKEQLQELFRVADIVSKKNKSEAIFNLYKCYKEDIAEVVSQNTIPEQFIDKEFKKYRTQEEYLDYLKKRGRKGKTSRKIA